MGLRLPETMTDAHARVEERDASSSTRWAGLAVFGRLDRRAAAAIGVGVLIVMAARLLPAGLPQGVLLRGAVLGSLSGLLAMGLVFVYRANQIINFAQGELGAFAATLSYELIVQSNLPYPVAVFLSIAAATALAALLEIAVLRRFARASRLIAAVVTIGLAQLLLFLQLIIPLLFERYSDEVGAGRLAFPSPYRGEAFTLSSIIFSKDALIALVVVPLLLVGLTLFFRRSWAGAAIRAAAQNGDRAGLLGVPVARLATMSWALAGALSAAGAILRAPITGYFPGDLGGAALLARALAAAAIGRFESLPATFAAAIAIATVEQVYTYNYSRAAPLDGIVLAIVVVALLSQRGRRARAGWGDTSSWKDVKEVRPVPGELRSLPEVRYGRLGATAALLVIVAALPFVLATNQIRLVSVVCIFAIVAVSLVILTGWAGQVSLGQWAIVGVGAFVTGRLATSGAPPNFVVTVLLAGVAAAFVSVVLGLPALRLQGLFYGVTTLAFAVAAGGWLFTLESLRPTGFVRRPEFAGIPLDREERFYYVVIASVVLILAAARNLRRSRMGRLLVASRDNPRGVAAFGVQVAMMRLAAFGIAGFLCGIAGSLYVFLVQTAEVADFKPDRSVLIFGVAVIGGLGSVGGAVLGAVYVLGSQYFLPSWGSFLATGIGVVLFLLAFPGGLGQLVYMARDRLLARVADRRNIVVPSLVADRAAALGPPSQPGPAAEPALAPRGVVS